MRADIAPGAPFPDFVLPDHTRTRRRLSDLQGDQLMVVVLTRGSFCPKDRQHMLELVSFHAQLVVGYTQLVTFTTDSWHATNNYRQQTAAHWPFLYDEERLVQKTLDIKEYTDTTHDVMIPHTIVLGRDLEVYKVYNGYYKSDFYPYGGQSISMETLMLQMAGAVDQYAGSAEDE